LVAPELRRQTAELLARYRLEPTIRDIFVEGDFDKRVIVWVVGNWSAASAAVYQIDTVDLPDGVVIQAGFSPGAKSRVLTLAQILFDGIGDSLSATCIVDADFDHIVRTVSANPLVLTTDYSSLEMYAFCEPCVSRWLALVAGVRDTPCEVVLAELTTILREQFAMRLANRELGWNMDWLPMRAGFGDRPKSLADFSITLFTEKLLHKNGRYQRRQEFAEATTQARGRLLPDIRHSAHGHDLADLLTEFAKCHSNSRWLYTSEAVLHSLIGTFTLDHLMQEPMFRALKDRLGRR
jgi:hypothetical protein